MNEPHEDFEKNSVRIGDYLNKIRHQSKVHESTFLNIKDILSKEYYNFSDVQKFESYKNLLAETENKQEYWNEKKELLENLGKLGRELQESNKSKGELENEYKRLIERAKLLGEKQELGYILNRVSQNMHVRIKEDHQFRERFFHGKTCAAFVVSMDIRKSTSLMLKARTPDQFAEFITGLCEELKQVIFKNNGVFDKFTGDGILAFFPDFMNEKNSEAVARAAWECHEVFRSHYDGHRKCFSAIMVDTGLAIGVDYGNVNIVQFGSDLSIVGEPVVYACRFGSGNPGSTLCNQPAIEKMVLEIGGILNINEVVISVKHEGDFLAYNVSEKHSMP